MNTPSLQGNWVDLVIILIVIFYLFTGWSRGFILGTIDLGGFLISFVSALKFYSFVGKFLVDNFSLTRGIANTLGFLLVGIFTELVYTSLFKYLANKFYPSISISRVSRSNRGSIKKLDKILGFVPLVGEAIIFTAFIFTLLVTLPIQGSIKKDIISSKIGGPLVAQTQGIESQLDMIFGEAVNETLTFITINPNLSSQQKIDLGFTQTEGKVDGSAENSMLTLINIERQRNGLEIIKSSGQLRDLARSYAKDMFQRGYFSHYNPEGESPFDRMEKANISFQAAGENLALAPNVVLAHHGLMNSSGHRANILSSDFKQVGIGVIDGGIYGIIFVQEFTN